MCEIGFSPRPARSNRSIAAAHLKSPLPCNIHARCISSIEFLYPEDETRSKVISLQIEYANVPPPPVDD